MSMKVINCLLVKSYAVTLSFRTRKTVSVSLIDVIMQKLITNLKKQLNAELR